ncbi:MFS transporter [Nonomuraea sp. NPDC050451]|uniref:MFS transporter n=1 Tax=Nonomuraea sp. NPDC050451 TaxID=3364364 RepID=UPI0037A787EC
MRHIGHRHSGLRGHRGDRPAERGTAAPQPPAKFNRLLWTARSITALGTGLLDVAVPAHIYAVTGSVLATGLSLAFRYLPALLLGPFAGVIADRWDRPRIMITTDLIHAMAISLVLLAQTPETIWIIYAAMLGQGAAAVIFRPAAQAHTPAVVGIGPLLSSANALGALTTGVVGLSAPPIGGLMFATSGINVVIGAAITASLLSATAIARTTTQSRAHGPAQNVLADLIQGLRHLRQAATTRALLATNSVYLLANAALTALLIPFAVTHLGESVQVGYLLSALGLGFLLGAPVSRRLVDRFSARTTLAPQSSTRCRRVLSGVQRHVAPSRADRCGSSRDARSHRSGRHPHLAATSHSKDAPRPCQLRLPHRRSRGKYGRSFRRTRNEQTDQPSPGTQCGLHPHPPIRSTHSLPHAPRQPGPPRTRR